MAIEKAPYQPPLGDPMLQQGVGPDEPVEIEIVPDDEMGLEGPVESTEDAEPLPVVTTPSDAAAALPVATTPSDAAVPAATDPAAAEVVPSEDGGARRLLLHAVARRALRA